MEITLTTPALLFSTLSLLLLAYTNRFVTLANVIRALHANYLEDPKPGVLDQIENLRFRVALIKNMQLWGVGSLFLCTLCMFVLFAGWYAIGKAIFALALLALLVSLGISIREIQLSQHALNIALTELEDKRPRN